MWPVYYRFIVALLHVIFILGLRLLSINGHDKQKEIGNRTKCWLLKHLFRINMCHYHTLYWPKQGRLSSLIAIGKWILVNNTIIFHIGHYKNNIIEIYLFIINYLCYIWIPSFHSYINPMWTNFCHYPHFI